jgi:hypothetical protein
MLPLLSGLAGFRDSSSGVQSRPATRSDSPSANTTPKSTPLTTRHPIGRILVEFAALGLKGSLSTDDSVKVGYPPYNPREVISKVRALDDPHSPPRGNLP